MENDLKEIYLDLLKKSLTHSIWFDLECREYQRM